MIKNLKSKLSNKFKNKFKKISNLLFDLIFLIPFLEKPLPKGVFGKKKIADKKTYLDLHKKAINRKNNKVDNFEKSYGFCIEKDWFSSLSLVTQTCVKQSELNFNHGRLLYTLVSKYIYDQKRDLNNNNDFTILETGTARGFSSLCMSKALLDNKANGKIITLDCIGHNEKMFWNCISDSEGKKTREELLSDWGKELSNIIFIQGWTLKTLDNLGLSRINFAFLDAQHTKQSVLKEFSYIYPRQKKGDIVFFDDYTPSLFKGVCDAVNEIKYSFPYDVEILNFDKNRGYAIAKRN